MPASASLAKAKLSLYALRICYTAKQMTKEIFGILAFALGVAAGIFYISGVIKHKTKPHRISWAIWSGISLLTLISYLAKDARWSALLALAAVINNLIIFLLSFKFGTGGSTLRDRIALAIGLVGIMLWAITSEPTLALISALSADAVGLAVTLDKIFKAPSSENSLAWGIATIASVCGLLAVSSYTFAQTVYPVYAVAAGIILTFMPIVSHHLKERS